MAQAEHDTTENSAAAHPVPSDADLVKLAYRAMGDLEEPLYDIRDFAEALLLMVEGLSMPASGAVSRVARSIEETAEAIQKARERLSRALHPRSADPGSPTTATAR